jgi:hypothetical protein
LQIPCTKCPAGVEPTSPAWKAGTFAARPRAQSLQFLRRKPWDSNPQASGCSPPVFKTGPSSGRMASVRQQTFSTQSCGGRNRTCVGMINSHLPVPTRAPPQCDFFYVSRTGGLIRRGGPLACERAPSGSRTRTSALARQQAAATSWVRSCRPGRVVKDRKTTRAQGGTRTHVSALRVRSPGR